MGGHWMNPTLCLIALIKRCWCLTERNITRLSVHDRQQAQAPVIFTSIYNNTSNRNFRLSVIYSINIYKLKTTIHVARKKKSSK